MKNNTRHWAGITAGILSLAGYASAATLGSEKYTYDASGNIIEKSIDGVITKMAFDQANRLVGRETAGQGKQTTAYDAAGRPVTERNADGQTTRNLSYGYGDKVLETRNRDSKAGFYYNAEGQLVGKKTDSGVATYTWDGNVLAADDSEAFANEAHISGGVPVLASGTNVVVSDHIGNTLVSGEKQFASTAYGEGLENGRFIGKLFVEELGGYVFNHRLYSPLTSRWNVSDPSGFPDGNNQYVYAKSDPLANIDALGLNTLPAEYKWSPNIPNETVGVIGTFNGTFIWTVVPGQESSSISVLPGWTGKQYYKSRSVSAEPADNQSWELHSNGTQKRFLVDQHIYIKETVGSDTTLLKDMDNSATGNWVEI